MRAAALLLLAACSAPAASVDAGCPPPVDRACTAPSDCALLNLQVDCCGSEVAAGVAASGRASGEQAERLCQARWPRCRCLAKDTVADDGKPFASGAAVQLRCTAGRCESVVP